MGPDIKKIRILLYVSLAIVFLETILGIGCVLSGYMYRSLDKDNAELSLRLLKINNNERYEKIIVEKDSLAIVEFYEPFYRTKNTILKIGGLLFLLFAFLHAVPAGLLLRLFMKIEVTGESDEESGEPQAEAEGDGGGGGEEIEF